MKCQPIEEAFFVRQVRLQGTVHVMVPFSNNVNLCVSAKVCSSYVDLICRMSLVSFIFSISMLA